MLRFGLVHSIRETVSPLPWRVWPVIPLEDELGPLGFASIRKSGFCRNEQHHLSEKLATPPDMVTWALSMKVALDHLEGLGSKEMHDLPVEFFNHELKDLDLSNTGEAAKTFSKFGLLGVGELSNILMESMRDLPTCYSNLPKTCKEFAAELASWQGLNLLDPAVLDDDATPEKIFKIYKTYLNRLALKIRSLNEAEIDLIEFAPMCEIELEVDILKRYAQIAKSSASCKTLEDLANDFGCPPSKVEQYLSVQLGLVNERFLSHTSISVGYTWDGENIVFPSGGVSGGTLGQAIALQIKQFAEESKSGYSVCSECGNLFIRKRSKHKANRNRRSNAKDSFCCDTCSNRLYQRNYRKSPAYKLKQAAKAEKAAKAKQEESSK